MLTFRLWGRASAAVLAAWFGLMAAACRHVSPAAPRPEGTSTITFVDPAPPPPAAKIQIADATEGQPSDVMLMASPIGALAKPVYPALALGRQHAPVILGVRIVVDETGRVGEVRTSPLALSTPGPYFAEFLAAVETAVADWRFRPAVIRHLVPVRNADGSSHWVVTRAEPAPCVLDVSFVFSVAGEVTSALRK